MPILFFNILIHFQCWGERGLKDMHFMHVLVFLNNPLNYGCTMYFKYLHF